MTDLSMRVDAAADASFRRSPVDACRPRVLLVALATASLIAVATVPQLRALRTGDTLLSAAGHALCEIFAVIVAAMVFAVSWSAHRPARSVNMTLLGCGFLAVAMLDLAHMMSYPGMPALLTPSSPQKAIVFWLSARTIAALTLLAFAARDWGLFQSPTRAYPMLFATVALSAAVFALEILRPDLWPRFFVDGQGVTPIKVLVETTAMAITIAAMGLLWKRPPVGIRIDLGGIATASYLLVLSSSALILYRSVHDVFSLVGHVYKVAAYYYIYRMTFVASVREPYTRLYAETVRKQAAQQQAGALTERLAAIVESSEDAIVSTDLDGIVTSWNAGAESMFGYPAEAMIGQRTARLIPASLWSEDERALARVRSGEHIEQFETVRLRSDGTPIDVSVRMSPLFDGTGRLVGTSRISRDIMERKRAESILRNYAARLQSLSRRLMGAEEMERRRLGRELHDRTGSNLSAMLLSVAVLRGKLGTHCADDVGSHLDDYEKLVRETMQHVRDVLSDLRPPALDDLGLVAALSQHVRMLSVRAATALAVQGEEPMPRMTPEQEIALFRIAQEAIHNALKYAAASRIDVDVSFDDTAVVMCVSDDGIGFDPTTRGSDGAGLGMVTMRERAEAIRADLAIESAPGRGTHVTVALPRASSTTRTAS